MAKEVSRAAPQESAPLDNYGDAAREHIRSRRAANSAMFFLHHLKPGMTLLDCGCGEGSITLDLAALVAPGQVVGVDLTPETITRARTLAADLGSINVRYEVGSVYDLPFSDASFDAVFSHALFEWLTDQPRALQEIKRVLKPQGVIGLRSPDFAARCFAPPDPFVEQFLMLNVRLRDDLGGDSKVGRRLRGLLHQAGFTDTIASASCEAYGTPESQARFINMLARFSVDSFFTREWLARGWATRDELEAMSAGMQDWARHPDATGVWWVWCEVVGWKG